MIISIELAVCFEYEFDNDKNVEKYSELVNIRKRLDNLIRDFKNLKENFEKTNTIVQSNRKRFLIIESELSNIKKDNEIKFDEQKNLQVKTFVNSIRHLNYILINIYFKKQQQFRS